MGRIDAIRYLSRTATRVGSVRGGFYQISGSHRRCLPDHGRRILDNNVGFDLTTYFQVQKEVVIAISFDYYLFGLSLQPNVWLANHRTAINKRWCIILCTRQFCVRSDPEGFEGKKVSLSAFSHSLKPGEPLS